MVASEVASPSVADVQSTILSAINVVAQQIEKEPYDERLSVNLSALWSAHAALHPSAGGKLVSHILIDSQPLSEITVRLLAEALASQRTSP